METFTIKSKTIECIFEKEFGNLISVQSPLLHWNILDRPHLGRNWELLIPLESRRNNVVHGYQQKLSSLTLSDDGKKADMIWSNIRSEYGGVHTIEVKLSVEATQDSIVWAMQLCNQDGEQTVIESVCSPILGDLRCPDWAEGLNSFTECGATPIELPIYPRFSYNRGYWGTDTPNLLFGSGSPVASAYLLIRADDQGGLYVAPFQDDLSLTTWRIRLFPGHVSESTLHGPTEDWIGNQEVYRTFDAIQFPFVRNGESASLTPVEIRAFQGDWQGGADIYRKQRDEVWQWSQPQTPKWAMQPHSWLQLQLNSPEDELRLRFTQLPEVARQCLQYGITAIQLVGWNHGGQDQGNPSHDPDPRLGTFEELKDAIAQCHALGVKIVLFAKFTWADTSTQWYQQTLHQYSIRDPWGGEYHHSGYQYQTTTQLLDINTHRFVSMCILSEQLRKLYVEEFKKMVALGAAGILIDEAQHKGNAHLCFATNHGHRPGAYVYSMDNKLIEEFRAVAPKDFLIAGECCYDVQYQQYDLCYFRLYAPDAVPIKRYHRPKNAPLFMNAVTGFDDRDVLNKCLLSNFVVSYEPFFFKGMPSDYPLTIGYGVQLQQLRGETRAYTWDGVYLHKQEAKVLDYAGQEYTHYSVFKAEQGFLGVVIVNFDTKQEIQLTVTLESGSISRWKAVGGQWETSDVILLPPRTAVVAIQE